MDRVFFISDYFEKSVHHLINHSFLNGHEQLRKEEVKESLAIGSVRTY